MVCKERFRVRVIEGLKPNEEFNARIEYGNMWHICEEAFAANGSPYDDLVKYCTRLCKKYPLDQTQIDKWYNVCLKQFPIYVDYWSKHKDVKSRTPLLQEETFRVPYELPSGRVVILRGKWDAVDLIGKGKRAGIYLQENKTKGTIDEEYVARQLSFDLQTMMYLIALKEYATQPDNEFVAGQQIKGVRYNVIRRPLSGGKGSIRQHKPTKSNPDGESKEDFYNRLQQYFIEEPEYWFMRWTVDIAQSDIDRFKKEFFDPCLEHICLWYDYMAGVLNFHRRQLTIGQRGIAASKADALRKKFEAEADERRLPRVISGKGVGVVEMPTNFLHYRFPYGVWNPLLEGKGTDVEEYLLSGSTAGLTKVDNLFPELEE